MKISAVGFNMILLELDKSNGVIILNKNNYQLKMKQILQYMTEITPSPNDPIKTIMKRETEVRTFHNELNKTNSSSLEQFKKISSTVILYSLHNLHTKTCSI